MAAALAEFGCRVKGRRRWDAAVAGGDFHVIICSSNVRFMRTSMI
jgi:hypothetical protein